MSSDINDLIVENVKARLTAMGKRPQWLAEQTGVSAGSISAFLNGVQGKDPRISTLIKFAKALECTIDDLCGNSPIVLKEDINALSQKIGELTMEIDRLKALLSKQAEGQKPQEPEQDYRERAAQALKAAKQVLEPKAPSSLQSPKSKSKA